MRRQTVKNCLVLSVAVLCMGLGPVLWAEERFQFRLLRQAGPNAGVAEKFEISIQSYTSLMEVSQLKDILIKRGYESFMSAFRGMSKGVLRPVGGRGIKIVIHAAHSIPKAKGRKILLFTQRQSWDADTFQRIDKRFHFMVIELDINKKGNGKGKIYEQASIQLTAEGTVEMESYLSAPLVLWGVQALKE